MTVDIERLEVLAKAASQGSWNQDGFDVQNDDTEDYRVSRCNLLADAKFIAAANPAAVLAMIASGKQQAQQFKEWQASHHANYCNVADERDQLRAEVAGLKTGYEAYERVNAELKAENETLIAAAQALRDEWRKDQADAERYRWLRDKQTFIWMIQDWFPSDAEFTDVDAAIDAAMGKGEQS